MTDPAKPFDLATARALCDAATPGPWEQILTGGTAYVTTTTHRCFNIGLDVDGPRRADARFISAARTGWPAALDALDDLEAARATLTAIRAAQDDPDLNHAETRIVIAARLRAYFADREPYAPAALTPPASGAEPAPDSGCACGSGADPRAKVDEDGLCVVCGIDAFAWEGRAPTPLRMLPRGAEPRREEEHHA